MSYFKTKNPNAFEDYFYEIDSCEKAYWIGWLLTDGTVDEKHGIGISLLNSDRYILEQFEKDLNLNKGHVKNITIDGYTYARFYTWCKMMVNDLTKYGIVPNKTLFLKFPINIKQKFYSHLLRGMFDGDGGIGYGITTRFYKNRNKTYTKPYQELNFTGTYDMCFNFQNILTETIGLCPRNITINHRTVYRVRWSSRNDIIKICNFLYDNSELHRLERKYKKFKIIESGDY